MNIEEARAWLAGERSSVNFVQQHPIETWQQRIAACDAAFIQQAYWLAKAYQEGLVSVPTSVPDIPVDDLIEKIMEYGGYRENEGGSYSTFQKFTARQYRSEADEVLAEIKAMLAASQQEGEGQ